MYGLIVLSLITFSVETIPSLGDSVVRVLRWTEIVIVVIFTVEYVARVWLATQKTRYVLSFFGIVDLLSIVPFYLGLAVDLRSMRILRFFRLFRALKFLRGERAVLLLGTAYRNAKAEIFIVLVATLIVLYIAAVGIYYFENDAQPDAFKSVFHSLWWAVATLTTVGYGDVYPVTLGGRLFTFVVLIVGLGVVALPAAVFSSALTTARQEIERAKCDSGEWGDKD